MLSCVAEGIYRCLHALGRVARFSSVEQTFYRCCIGPITVIRFRFRRYAMFVAQNVLTVFGYGWFRAGAHEVIPRSAVVSIGVSLCALCGETEAMPTSRSMVESRS